MVGDTCSGFITYEQPMERRFSRTARREEIRLEEVPAGQRVLSAG
jgi:hypothetical protein